MVHQLKSATKMKKAPAKIYLQRRLVEPGTPYEVTWCDDRINKEDVEYVRADLVEARIKRLVVKLLPDGMIDSEDKE